MKCSLVVFLMLIPTIAFAQATTPVYVPPSASIPAMSRHIVTFEANVGVGLMWARSGGSTADTEPALAGLDLGIGGWLSDSFALSLRGVGATFRPTGGVLFTTGFLGPSLQYWTDDHFWFGGGAGLGFDSVGISGNGPQPKSDIGFGLDLRAGFTLNPSWNHTVNVSIELTPGFFKSDNVWGNSFGLLLGYQYL